MHLNFPGCSFRCQFRICPKQAAPFVAVSLIFCLRELISFLIWLQDPSMCVLPAMYVPSHSGMWYDHRLRSRIDDVKPYKCMGALWHNPQSFQHLHLISMNPGFWTPRFAGPCKDLVFQGLFQWLKVETYIYRGIDAKHNGHGHFVSWARDS